MRRISNRLAIASLAAAMAFTGVNAFGGMAYIGTLDKKLLVIDEEKEEVVGEIALPGIPRATALSADQKKLHLITTQMLIVTVDLPSRQVTSAFSIADPRSRPRITATAPDVINAGGAQRYSGLAVDPGGRYLYTTMRVAVKDIDQYRVDPPKFVAIDLIDKKIGKAWDFPKDLDQGFGFAATYKVSPDGKLLYVFQEDILIFDLATFKEVDRIPLSQPEYPGASPYRLAVSEDPFDAPDETTSVFTSVDETVRKGTLGLAKINLTSKKVEYFPVGPSIPMISFMMSPDRKKGYSVMPLVGTGGNRVTEFWEWDIEKHKVVRKKEFESRPTFRVSMTGDGKKLCLYGAGSTLEFYDATTLTPGKLLYLNKDTTTNLVAIAR